MIQYMNPIDHSLPRTQESYLLGRTQSVVMNCTSSILVNSVVLCRFSVFMNCIVVNTQAEITLRYLMMTLYLYSARTNDLD